DGLQAGGTVQEVLDPLPPLPFERRPPIAGLAGRGSGALCVLDPVRLRSADSAEPVAPPVEPLASAETESAEPTLALLPELPAEDGGDVVVPAISGAQLLGIESASEAVALPGLPAWCLGVGWRQDEPIAVFDLRKRLLAAPPEVSPPTRWVIAALPGGGRVALALEGSCRTESLPERAAVVPAKSPLGSAIHGLFQVENQRLALLDLERWQRPDSA
ncbi:MAG: chemotaxis protein CheW, partial [Acidobacteriota bacterium]